MRQFLFFFYLLTFNSVVVHSSEKGNVFYNKAISFEKQSKVTLNDTIPSLKKYFEVSDCLESLNLTDLEEHLSYLYWVSNYISVSNNYRINTVGDIKMKAGKTIVLKPNTTVLKGSKYLAKIENCENFCGELIFFPKFFTPNGDGYNDYWKIQNVESLNSASIMIFDRFGKLLKSLNANEIGWDGSHISSALPSTDYWFILTYIDCEGKLKKVKSHFALKR